jgi:hypothetical protein
MLLPFDAGFFLLYLLETYSEAVKHRIEIIPPLSGILSDSHDR